MTPPRAAADAPLARVAHALDILIRRLKPRKRFSPPRLDVIHLSPQEFTVFVATSTREPSHGASRGVVQNTAPTTPGGANFSTPAFSPDRPPSSSEHVL